MEVVLAVIVFLGFSPCMLMMMQINLSEFHFTSLVYRLLGPRTLFTWMHMSFESSLHIPLHTQRVYPLSQKLCAIS